MKKVCEFDGVEFEAKRSTARFCSTNCRVKAAQAAGADPETGEVLQASITPVVAANDDNPPQEAEKSPEVKAADEEPYDREANLKAFQKMGLDQVSWISTGIAEFDKLTKIPRGRLTQIEGRYGVGKTTLCLNMIKGLRDKKVLYIDSEASLNPDLLADLKLSAKNFVLYNQSGYLEDIAQVIREAVKASKYEMIILDSVAMTTTKTRESTEITSKDIGQKASVMNKLLELIMGDVRDSKTALVFINQTRDSIGGYGPPTYTPGGSGILYNASLMISLRTNKSMRFPAKPLKAKTHIYLGHEVEATITKNKVGAPWGVRKFKLLYPNPQPVEELPMAEFGPMEIVSATTKVQEKR